MKAPIQSMLLALFIGLQSAPAQAEKKPLEERFFYRPFRIGLCGGWSTECQVASTKIELATKYVGVNLHVGVVPIWAGYNIKVYPTPMYDLKKATFRPYAFYGQAGIFMGDSKEGGGVGTDIHLFDSKRLLLQPSVSVFQQSISTQNGESTTFMTGGGSVAVMAAF